MRRSKITLGAKTGAVASSSPNDPPPAAKLPCPEQGTHPAGTSCGQANRKLTLIYRPRGVFQARPDILDSKLGVLGHDLTGAQPVGHQPNHGRYGDTCTGHARDTAHDPVINRNTPDVHPHIVGPAPPVTSNRRTGRLPAMTGPEPAGTRVDHARQHVCAFGNVQVSAQAMRSLFERDIDVFHFSYGGWLIGLSTGLPSKNVMLRIRQTTAAARGQLEAPRQMIAGKIRNCRVLLRRNVGEPATRVVGQLGELAGRAEKAGGAAELLGIEGAAARLYFGAFPQLAVRAGELPGPAFSGLRNRRPPADAAGCLLSFCYGLLTKEVLAACLAVGFDPYIGLFHRPRFGRPALALDLAEEFRPLLADSTVLTLINNREVAGTDFVVRAGAVALTPDGRKAVIRAWERRMRTELRHPMFGYAVSYRRAAGLQARILAAYLTGELPAYEPLVTR